METYKNRWSRILPAIRALIVVIGLPGSLWAQSELFAPPERGFTSWLPAPDWEHALLSGNGTMGALVFGHPHEETIILSHAALYLPHDRSDKRIPQAEKLEEIRRLIREGKYAEAAKIPVALRNEYGYTDERDPFIPAFDVKIIQEAANINTYLRSTNFSTGEAIVTWSDDTGTFQRKLFVSRADSLIVLSIKGNRPINCRIRFDQRPVEWNQRNYVYEHADQMQAHVEKNWLTYSTHFKKQYDGSLKSYEGVGKVIVTKGNVKPENDYLKIEQAEEVLVLIDIRPSYQSGHSSAEMMKAKINTITSDYNELLNRHVAIHGKLFNKVQLTLNSTPENKKLHSEELILKAKNKGASHVLIEKVFDAGRYNILSATGTHPPNLQGIWSGTWTAPWSSGFTHDGNLPAAMASVLSGNMPELMNAYVSYLEKYRDDFEENARKLFGTRGINLPGHTTTSGWPTDFGEIWCLTLWTGGAGWAADILYDYYRYTGDVEFLKAHAYPWMKQAAFFYEDFLANETGKLVFNPSYSPENNPANSPSQAAINATMDVMIAKQLLENTIKAGELLHEKSSQLEKWKALRSKLPPYEVNKEGVLREWLWPGLEDNYRHRHVSQLYSLFNACDETILNDPVLKAGAKKLLDKKLAFRREEGGGEMAFGLVQLGLSAAHLGEAEQALETVQWLASQYWSTGFGSFHNVGGLFNTDISGGLPAVIIEMLVYSEKGKIQLLPALPGEWKSGSLEGALLRNQIELKTLRWQQKEVEITLISAIDQKVTITLPENSTEITGPHKSIDKKTATVTLTKNKPVNLRFSLAN